MKTIGKKILLLLLTGSLFASVSAQQSTSKEINKIKRSNSYLYAEATMDSETEAAEVAYELLMKQVDEFVASKKKLTFADNVLIKDIRSHSEQMSMMRGEMHRVFVYVKKSDIEGVMNTTVVNAASGATITINDNPLLAPAHSSAETPQTVASTPQLAPQGQEPRSNDETSVPVEEIALDASEEAPQPMVSSPQPEADSPRTVEETTVETDLVGWQQRVVAELLECSDITSVRAKLNRLKAQYRVKRFGTADKCPNRAESCWILFDNSGKLLTILGAGEESRIDYRQMKPSSLSNFKGMNALWFKF